MLGPAGERLVPWSNVYRCVLWDTDLSVLDGERLLPDREFMLGVGRWALS